MKGSPEGVTLFDVLDEYEDAGGALPNGFARLHAPDCWRQRFVNMPCRPDCETEEAFQRRVRKELDRC